MPFPRRLTRRRSAWFVGLLVLATGGLAIFGCSDRDGSSTEVEAKAEGGIVVVASIHPLADLAEELLGELGETHTLLPAGTTPHGFSPTPDAVRTLRGADLLLTVGRGLDPWATRLAERVDDPPPVLNLAATAAGAGLVKGRADFAQHDADDQGHEHDASDHPHDNHADADHANATEERDEHHDPTHESEHADHADHPDHGDHDHLGPNPHLWLDPHAVRAFARELAATLETQLPEEHRSKLHANRDDLLRRIDEIDAAYRQSIADLTRRRMVTFHNAFDPLAERYGLEVVAHLTPIGLGGGGEVTPGRLDAAVRAIRQHDVPAVYVEPQFSDAVARRIAERTGVEVLTLDPLGHPHMEGRRGWFELMRFNLEQLVKGQAAKPTP